MKKQNSRSLFGVISKLLKRNLINRNVSKEAKRRSEIAVSNTDYAIYNDIVPESLAYEKE